VSYLGVLFTFVFAQNVVMEKLLGFPDASAEGQPRASLIGALLFLALSVASSLAGWFLWSITRRADYAFLPAYTLYFIAVSIAFEFLARKSRGKIPEAASLELKRIEYSGIAFGLGSIVAQAPLGPLKALAAGAASVCGYAAARFLLGKIMERLELSDVPKAFKGTPAMLLNAGLIALAFMSLDQAILRNITP
jgi:Na+-translocating ferredoxin:NAD+ oxidoreductase subunit A